MTYQYLTVDMINTAKENGRFTYQKTFKTAGKYGFDSLILTDTNMRVLDGYISFVRPLRKPKCDVILVTRNEGQHSKLGEIVSKLVFMQLENTSILPVTVKLPKRKVPISSLAKSKEFCRKTQKHSSAVAKVQYQKQRSREVAVKDVASAYKSFKGPKGQKWTRTSMQDLALQLQALRLPLKQYSIAVRPPKRMPYQKKTCSFRGIFVVF